MFFLDVFRYISFFYGSPCRVFNVGEYLLRLVDGKFQKASFFDESNEEAKSMSPSAAFGDEIIFKSKDFK